MPPAASGVSPLQSARPFNYSRVCLLLLYGMLLWYVSMVCFYGTKAWCFYGMLLWYASMVLCNGATIWFYETHHMHTYTSIHPYIHTYTHTHTHTHTPLCILCGMLLSYKTMVCFYGMLSWCYGMGI